MRSRSGSTHSTHRRQHTEHLREVNLIKQVLSNNADGDEVLPAQRRPRKLASASSSSPMTEEEDDDVLGGEGEEASASPASTLSIGVDSNRSPPLRAASPSTLRNSLLHNEEIQLRSQILQAQLKLALCQLDMEVMYSVRHSLSTNNSAMNTALQVLSNSQERAAAAVTVATAAAGDTARMQKEKEKTTSASNVKNMDSEDTKILTSLIGGGLAAFSELQVHIQRLEARAKQLVSVMHKEDKKRASGVIPFGEMVGGASMDA